MQKKCGIITMHRVNNYGSVLQAYALQRSINVIFKDCTTEIIDYYFPKRANKNKKYNLKKIFSVIIDYILRLKSYNKNAKIERFICNNLILSKRKYLTNDELKRNPPKYDIYITGSDQVWSEWHVKNDLSFLLNFVTDNSTKVSYASSFGKGSISKSLSKYYSFYLNQYKSISVREISGVDKVFSLIQKKVEIVCDPTLLLDSKTWIDISKKYLHKPKEPYLIAYILCYSFDPYPYADYVIDYISKKLNLKVVRICAGRRYLFKHNTVIANDIGPEEFLDLFANASYVITTSYHGTIFSLSFEKPFISIVERSDYSESFNENTQNQTDDRVLSLLKLFDFENRAVQADKNSVSAKFLDRLLDLDYNDIRLKINEFRQKSIDYLRECLM